VTRQQIALYTLPMAAAAVAPWPLGLAGADLRHCGSVSAWPLPALASGARQPATEPSGMKPEKRLFAFSILYLFAIFGALVLDRWLA
jgi:protoheme IX farnesyltransferase